MQSIEVSVNKCNVTFENGTADTFEFTYWGIASSSIYSVKATLEENVQKTAVLYIGDGTPPTHDEGGVTIKIPDKEFQLLSIAGKYSGLTLDNMKMDVNLTTRAPLL